MKAADFATVTVTWNGEKLVCSPDFVHCFWESGPRHIRWVFESVPAGTAYVVVEYLERVPSKYSKVPPGNLGRGPFRGFGFAPSSGSSKLPDLITTANTREKGYACYKVMLFGSDGEELAVSDPGNGNDPYPPGGEYPEP